MDMAGLGHLEVAGDHEAAATLRAWARDPDAIFAQAWFEADSGTT